MRIVCTADLHGWLPDDLPEGDVLVIAGDISPREIERDDGMMHLWSVSKLDPWLTVTAKRYTHGIVATAGNHDFYFEKNHPHALSLPWQYLINTHSKIGGVWFFGTPLASTVERNAYVSSEEQRREHFDRLKRQDEKMGEEPRTRYGVFVSHGPPAGVSVAYGMGSQALADFVSYAQPELVVCGHIHEGRGQDVMGRTLVVNATMADREMKHKFRAQVVEIEAP